MLRKKLLSIIASQCRLEHVSPVFRDDTNGARFLNSWRSRTMHSFVVCKSHQFSCVRMDCWIFEWPSMVLICCTSWWMHDFAVPMAFTLIRITTFFVHYHFQCFMSKRCARGNSKGMWVIVMMLLVRDVPLIWWVIRARHKNGSRNNWTTPMKIIIQIVMLWLPHDSCVF